MPGELVVTRDVAIPMSEISIRTSRSSGPGGQHANVTASRVEATLDVARSRALSEDQRRRVMARVGPRLTAVAQDSRSQTRNRDLALERLRRRLAAALAVGPRRIPTSPTPAARARRRAEKESISRRKAQRRAPPDAEH